MGVPYGSPNPRGLTGALSAAGPILQDYTNAACLALVSYRRQFKLENRASGCPGGYPNPTVMVFND